MDPASVFLPPTFKQTSDFRPDLFIGPDESTYKLVETTFYYGIQVTFQNSLPGLSENCMLCFYRFYPDEEIIQYMHKALQLFLPDPAGYLRPENMYTMAANYTRGVIGRKIGKFEWACLSELYDTAVRAGAMGWILTYACKEVLMIMTQPADLFVFPELHEMLLEIPDIYYDFILGIECNIKDDIFLQNRLLQFLKNHPGLSSTEVIIVSSSLNENRNMSEEKIWSRIYMYRINTIFRPDRIPDQKNEVTCLANKFDWKITTTFVKDHGYTLRHAGSICFIDYENRCIGCCLLRQYDSETAEILSLEINDPPRFPGVLQKLLAYAERMASTSGIYRLGVISNNDTKDFYLSEGFVIADKKYQISSERLALVKVLEHQVYDERPNIRVVSSHAEDGKN